MIQITRYNDLFYLNIDRRRYNYIMDDICAPWLEDGQMWTYVVPEGIPRLFVVLYAND